MDSPSQLNAQAPATRIGDALKQVTAEAGSLPIGAVVLLSDGADNSGGIDLTTLSEVRRHRIPIHTVGIGREKMERDVEIIDAQMPTRVLADSRLAAQVTLRKLRLREPEARVSTSGMNGKTVATRELRLKADGKEQTEAVLFNAGAAGIKTLN